MIYFYYRYLYLRWIEEIDQNKIIQIYEILCQTHPITSEMGDAWTEYGMNSTPFKTLMKLRGGGVSIYDPTVKRKFRYLFIKR